MFPAVIYKFYLILMKIFSMVMIMAIMQIKNYSSYLLFETKNTQYRIINEYIRILPDHIKWQISFIPEISTQFIQGIFRAV